MNTTNNKYNGWCNYATWRIVHEIFNNGNFADLCNNAQDTYDLASILKEYVHKLLKINSNSSSLAYSYACAFLMEVNFYEIAENMWNEYQTQNA